MLYNTDMVTNNKGSTMKTIYKLTVNDKWGKFYESHRHHDQDYLETLSKVYQKHGYITTISIW